MEGRPRPRLGEQELARLLAVGRTLVAELDVEAVLDQVVRTARDLTGARYAALGILDERKEELERFLFVGIDEKTRQMIGPLPRGRGVLGELIRNPGPLRLEDVTKHPRSYGFPPGHPPMRTFLGVPITIRGEAFGNLYLTDKEGGAQFDDKDEESVLVLAEWAAISIDNARLYERVERRRRELERAVRGLEATATIARTVGFETDLERVLELIVKRGRALVDSRALIVLLEQPGGQQLEVVAAAGDIPSEVIGTAVPVDRSIAGSVLATGSTERIASLADRVSHGLGPIAEGATAAIVAPLDFRGRARGAMVALDREHDGPAFEADEAHLLGSFAASAAIAIATAQSVEGERLRHSIRAAEAERKRWARELHDETLQDLGAIKVLLQSALRGGDPEAVRTAAERTIEQIDLSIKSLQSLITELRPAALDELGVQPAVEALVKRTSALSGIAIETRIDLAYESGRTDKRHSPELESTLYRLLQEALTNTVKHADAENVWIEIVEHDDRVKLVVRDDGRGFDPAARDGGGFGLVGMHERVQLVGGRLSIEAAPGSGTVVTAELPVNRAPAAGARAAG